MSNNNGVSVVQSLLAKILMTAGGLGLAKASNPGKWAFSTVLLYTTMSYLASHGYVSLLEGAEYNSIKLN